MSLRLRLLIIGILFLTAGSGQAFDGQRKGLVFGGGIGFGTTRIGSDSYLGENSTWRAAPAFDWQLGYCPDNRMVIFIGTKSVLTYLDLIADQYQDYFDAMQEDNLKGVAACIGAPIVLPLLWMGGAHTTFGLLGVSYYFEDQAPSYFVEATIGAGIIPDEFRSETFGGLGFTLAGGWEFSTHYSLRCDLMFGFSTEGNGSDFLSYGGSSSAFSIMLTFNSLAY